MLDKIVIEKKNSLQKAVTIITIEDIKNVCLAIIISSCKNEVGK